MAKRSEKVSTIVKKKTYETLQKYSSKTSRSKSEIINEALEQYFKIEGTKDNIDFITKEIDRIIELRLKDFEDRICRIMAKTTKSSLAGLYFNINVLENLCDTEESKEFIKEAYLKANKKAYEVLKSGFLERDILTLFPEKIE